MKPGVRAALQRRFAGTLVAPGDRHYERARRVWNGCIDRRPALIAYCAGTADVAAALRVAREHELAVAVRGGGHSCAGLAVCDDGVVIDLSRMNSVAVDPAGRIVRAGAGALWQDVDRATQVFALATPGGTDSEVGIAGLTLGGGNGWLMGLHGATCDNVLSVDVIDAEGHQLVASAEENADLFWALRGGGGNFAVATAFEYRLHPVGPTVIGGMVLYAIDEAREVIAGYREFTRTAPDEVTAYACLIFTEAGRPAVAIAACAAAPLDRAEAMVGPLRRLGRPVADQLGPMAYTALQSILDPARPAGRRCAMRSHFMRELDDRAIDVMIGEFLRSPSPLSVAIVEHCHGAIARVPPTETAFALRDSPFHLEIIAFWEDAAQTDANVKWVQSFFAATEPFSSGQVYVNSLDRDEAHRVREAYGMNYERLTELKRRYDPDNVFRSTHNIPPTPIGR